MVVEFYAYYRGPEYAGCTTVDWTEEPDTVLKLCRQIAVKYGNTFRAELLTPDGNNVSEKTIVLVNGRRIDFLDGVNTVLKETDNVKIFPVVAGG